MSEGLDRIAHKAKEAPQERFFALAHHLTEDFLKETFALMNRRGAPGVDRVSMAEYGLNLDANVADLVARLKGGRTMRPKSGGYIYRRAAIQRRHARWASPR